MKNKSNVLIKFIMVCAMLMSFVGTSSAQVTGFSFYLMGANGDNIGNLQQSTARLRTTIVKTGNNISTPGKLLQQIPDSTQKKKKILTASGIEPPIKTVTSGTIYDVPGGASSKQCVSLVANFAFNEKASGRTVAEFARLIELYKLETGNGIRSFSIPLGSTTATQIPIQIIQQYGSKGQRIYSISFPSGNLQPGEYAFIDKSSATADGSALACFTFGIMP